ncbi:carboxylesterase family protein [Nocardiopsis dassonvillei]|nr:carboxylesterase family protein [Nocardiopsis dassonvillei]
MERYGAYHGAEVPYAYDNLGADSDADYTETDYRLRGQMSVYWVNFARTGDPNGPGLPAWPTVAQEPEQVMEFDGGSAVAPRPRPEAVDFWMEFDGPVP